MVMLPVIRSLSYRNPFVLRGLIRRSLATSASPSTIRHERILQPAGHLYKQRRRPPTMSFEDFRLSYQMLTPGQSCPDHAVVQNGRVLRKRESGRSLFFLDVACGHETLQMKCSSKEFESGDLFDLARSVTRGDYISVLGFPTRSSKGQLLLCARDCQILAPCQHPIPDVLESPEIRQRQRYLDMIVNASNVQNIFRTRAKVISFIRRFLEEERFVEVETPILWGSAGGANANPFTTQSSALDSELHLRIAPELFLKQLIIGGLDRVFELGKVFRNEGMDREHHPEFTSCEFYMAHADYLDLIPLTERLLSGITDMLGDQSKIRFKSFDRLDCLTVLNDEVSKLLGSQIDIAELLNEEERSVSELKRVLSAANLPLPKLVNATSIVDCLISNIVEPKCINPTFLMNHPTLVSPLAKAHVDRPYITERFELFIQGQEICNAYSELADPEEQRQRFQHQEMLRSQGDTEKRPCSDDFCEALEYGMPPTAGWGIGIDRLCRLLTGASHIRDVILFPALRPKQDNSQAIKITA